MTMYKDRSFKKKWNELTESEKLLADSEINKFVAKLVNDRELSDDIRQEIAKRLLEKSRKSTTPEDDRRSVWG
ncbi:hypothetical protein [Phyllobacterium zundukense]|uniref:Uncharacterized protein n=1 Tax=Phyllobacterium zundukense TaxID=1867719 RepID=A0ACD4D939_9HYPH|nr:hypothetical protein [Phyllobacterium zundukense]UXN62451.1 hypothetical protein N8E88_20980 [Phyllobacterium zundukense]